jgi:hypothetical protein
MNILMFSKLCPDYLHDVLYHGLRQLGHVVHDYPRKTNLHHPEPTSGLLEFNWDEQSIQYADVLMICAQPADYRDRESEYYEYLNFAIQSTSPKKIIVVDGHDLSVSYPSITRQFDKIFKRELYQEQENTIQFPFAALPETLVHGIRKEYDVLFVGSYSGQPFRVDVRDALTHFCNATNIKAVISLDPVSRDEYIDLVRKSRLVVSVRGFGWDCYRYWELPAMGAVMLTETIPINFKNDFIDGVDCFKFATGDLNDMCNKITEALKLSHGALEKIGMSAWYKTQVYHTAQARAKFLLENI